MALRPGEVLQIRNTITGEIITETSDPNASVYMGKRKHPGGFIIVYESEFRDAALMLKDHGALPLCLWMILMTKVEIGTGEILINTVELAEMLQSHQPNVSRGIKTLAGLGLIQDIRKEGKHKVVRINPSTMWKGRETERQQVLRLVHNETVKKGRKPKANGSNSAP
jgi:DNA-binding transcriptional ArsR family regulator